MRSAIHNLLQQFGHPFLFQESNNFVQKFFITNEFLFEWYR